MSRQTYEIRKCESCGLRYPLRIGNDRGTRCPVCMGLTNAVHTHEIKLELTSLDNFPGAQTDNPGRLAVLLDNIRSAANVGSILRSAEGLGFLHAYHCGITPTPENDSVQKTSLGAENTVTWSYHKDAVKLVTGLKREGMRIIALEEHERAVPIEPASVPLPRAVLIAGNEVTGVDPELLELCDEIVFIPMRGEKKSFNVAVAFGIAAYALTTRR